MMDKTRMNIDVKKVLNKAGIQISFDKYAKIMRMFEEVNVLESREFQRFFNGFYRVRRGAEWQKRYYAFFEECRKTNPTFESIIIAIYKQTGNVEASFASKMLHTINSDMPIWDKFVLKQLKKKLTGKTKEEKIKNAIHIYKEIIEWYKTYLKTREATECIKELDSLFPIYCWFSKTKKIDFLLWQMREDNI